MILMILDFKGRHLGVPNASRSTIHMIFGPPEGGQGEAWGTSGRKVTDGHPPFS